SDAHSEYCDRVVLTTEKLACTKYLKEVRRGRIHEYAAKFKAQFHPGERPWKVPCDVAFPSAHENEIEKGDAEALVKNGCKAVGEGANMPNTIDATNAFLAG